MPIAHINGLNIFYHTAGSGEKVVLTHGSWTSSDTWQALTPLLADRYEVVAWDRRGHSRSEDGEAPGSWKEDASDLAALIEHLGDGPVHVVGNSSGGAIVLNLLAARPDLVKSAAVHEPGVFPLLEGIDDEALAAERAAMERVRDLLEAREYREAARYFVDEIAIGPGTWDGFPAELRDALEANAPTFLDELDEPFEIDSIDWDGLRRSNAPLLVTFGTESSHLERASTQALAQRVTCELKAATHSGHIPHRTHPDAYASLLIDFFDRSMSVL